ncbi:hypothetical protein NUW54_g12102 [Trametes sanguinea]|uniref:Uncharacterized protein n=1 Tax=Trametes sanguinea TaxID=158606 RepID=A0ACC1N3M7_9APHY|nr:hypothetical protein NUW54_g12102 [Trametes sanguinea]
MPSRPLSAAFPYKPRTVARPFSIVHHPRPVAYTASAERLETRRDAPAHQAAAVPPRPSGASERRRMRSPYTPTRTPRRDSVLRRPSGRSSLIWRPRVHALLTKLTSIILRSSARLVVTAKRRICRSVRSQQMATPTYVRRIARPSGHPARALLQCECHTTMAVYGDPLAVHVQEANEQHVYTHERRSSSLVAPEAPR